jgi:hypothetical protein
MILLEAFYSVLISDRCLIYLCMKYDCIYYFYFYFALLLVILGAAFFTISIVISIVVIHLDRHFYDLSYLILDPSCLFCKVNN